MQGETELSFEKLRERMVIEQLQSRDITDPQVLHAMRTVPRHLFVPPNLEHLAYSDGPLPIGEGQTISQPYIVALMTQLAHPQKVHKILEIGTGSGYQAAVLSLLYNEVYSIEILESLAKQAKERLERLGYRNVHTRSGNGYFGWPEAAPFDAIIVTAGATEVPPALVEQLKPGGRMVIPVGSHLNNQLLEVVEKDAAGKLHTQSHTPVRFVPLRKQ
ncbi:MAG TPA: protein-L-isoaspartate(D-aspartate) O-methyltransferase [Acidobacteriota bacterium]|jgi:protein-L-isoaspartate(D-aspartate) O-methyltransferase|nr:protein-L-isoaspartate(D-aspartate) O-methyltransferase [Acidobacteriota bacterium]